MGIDKNLLKGSLILLIMFNLYNVINFIFQITMARLLTLEEYGILATIFSLVFILGMFSESIQTVVAKYTSVEDKNEKVKNILKRALSKAIIAGFGILLAYLMFSILLSYLLNIQYWLLALNGGVVLAAFIVPVARGILQGKERFGKLGGNMIIEALTKLILAIIFVFMGWGVYGAVGASIAGSAAALVFSLYFIRDITKTKEKRAEIISYKGFSTPVLYVVSVIFIFFSLDIIIAKAVFSSEIAGVYSIISILGKTIFLGVQPISKAMFPIASSKNKKKGLLNHSLIMISVLIIIALTAFFIFPSFITSVFSGKQISGAFPVLFLVGAAYAIQAITNAVLLYKLAGKNIKNYVYLGAVIPLQIILLILFSSTLLSYSLALIAASAIFLIGGILLSQHGKK